MSISYVDAQTGFMDRKRAETDLASHLSRSASGGGYVVCFDLDDFQALNASLGARYGDMLISNLSHVLRGNVLIKDRIYRIGGDRFMIILNGESRQQLNYIISDLKRLFQNPWVLDGALHVCSASVGVVKYPNDGADIETLMSNLNKTVWHAKSAGKNIVKYFGQSSSPYDIPADEIERELRRSIANGFKGFELHYQPVYDIMRGKIVRAEALLRWTMPSYGLISPSIFIPVAERKGLIDELGRWALRKTAEQFKLWKRDGADISVSVNLSAHQLNSPGLVEFITDLFDDVTFTPLDLTLEIAERDTMKNFEKNCAQLLELRDIGVNIALDGFGTGFSSIARLKDLPFNMVNIDRSIIKDAEETAAHRSFVRNMVDSAHDLDISVCASGIENKTQMEIFSLFDIDSVQGYYLGRPMNAGDFSLWTNRVKPDRHFGL